MTTKEVTTTGFILRSMDYKESDAILHIYTKEYGKISFIAKGVKKMKSKNASGCQTLTLSEFTFIPRKGLSTLLKATPVNYYRHIKEDIELEIYASYFSEFIYKFTEENDPDEQLYNDFMLAINYLEKGYYFGLLYVLYNAMILKITGTPLLVDGCAYCGSSNHIVGISYTGGGFVCQNCIGEYDIRLPKETLQAFRHINKYPFSKIDEIQIESQYIQALIPIMEHYIDEYTGMTFKSRTFIKQFQVL
ncbi:MAG: DNA repair protein RecO [Coprobacillaceae bacterium]